MLSHYFLGGLFSEDFFVRGSWGFVVYKVWEAREVQ